MSQKTLLDAQAVAQLFTDASTPRGFTNEAVSTDEIIAAYDIAKWAPTAFNGQPLRLVVVNSPEKRAELVDMVMEGNQERVRTAPQVVIVAADREFHKNFPVVNPFMADAPMWGNEEFRHNVATSQTWLQMGYFILALRGQGLAVGPMTGIHNAQINDAFFAGTSLEVAAVLAIGHADEAEARPRNPRIPANEAITVI